MEVDVAVLQLPGRQVRQSFGPKVFRKRWGGRIHVDPDEPAEHLDPRFRQAHLAPLYVREVPCFGNILERAIKLPAPPVERTLEIVGEAFGA